MRFYLISDNTETLTGLRLAGVDGVVAHDADAVGAALDTALAADDIAVLILTRKAASFCRARVESIMTDRSLPLVVEIPDRHGGDESDLIAGYISEAVGL